MPKQLLSSLKISTVASFKKKPKGNPGDAIFHNQTNRIRIYGSYPGKYSLIQDKITLDHVLESLGRIRSDSTQDYQLLMSHGIKGGFGSVSWDSNKDAAVIVGDIETRFFATLQGMDMLGHVYCSLEHFQKDF